MGSEPPGADLARPETKNSLFAGHLGHLSQEQESALDAFKRLLIEKGLYRAPTPEDSRSIASHSDGTLLRFLRARKFNVQEAYQQFKDTEEWRKANHLDLLYDNIEVHDYEETRRLYPQWTGRRDRRGIPVYVYEIKSLDSKRMAAYHKSASKTPTLKSESGKGDVKLQAPARLIRLFALYENLVQFVTPLCTRLLDRPCPEVPITQTNNIVDISGVGLGQFWNLRSHMQDASTLATAHYPETLDRIFIIGAPSFFHIVWGWIKKWFDPITTSKIFILTHSEVLPTLTKFIEPANIPQKYGGQLKYEFGMMPVLDDAALESLVWSSPSSASSASQQQANGVAQAPLVENGAKSSAADLRPKTFPTGPLRWIEQDGEDVLRGERDLIAMGSVNGKERREKIAVQKRLPQ